MTEPMQKSIYKNKITNVETIHLVLFTEFCYFGMEMTFNSFNAVLMIPLVSKINPHIIETATIEVTTGI